MKGIRSRVLLGILVMAVSPLASTAAASADIVVQSNIAGNHQVVGANWAGVFIGTLPPGDPNHMRLALDRINLGGPEVVAMNEVCLSQAVFLTNYLSFVAPGQYKAHFNNAFPAGGAPGGGCAYGNVSGFGNFIAVRSNSPAWVAGGILNGTTATLPIEYKTWACMDGGYVAPRFTACTTHYWPKYIWAGFACNTIKWTRDSVMNPYYARYGRLALIGDIYLTRTPYNGSIGSGSPDGTIDGCSPPGLLTWWKSNFASYGGNPSYNLGTLLSTSGPQVDHVIVDGGRSYNNGPGWVYSRSSCPQGTTFEQCNLTDHLVVYANPNL